MTKTALRPDQRSPAQNSYLFPARELPPRRPDPAPDAIPSRRPLIIKDIEEPASIGSLSGYQQPGLSPAGYQQAVAAAAVLSAAAIIAQPRARAFATIEMRIAADYRPPARPDGELSVRDAAAAPDCRRRITATGRRSAPAAIPCPRLCAAAFALCRPSLSGYARATFALRRPRPDLSGLEAHLRNITAQIETLRQPAPDFSGALRNCAAICARSAAPDRSYAAPRRRSAGGAKSAALAERSISAAPLASMPDAIAGMERSLNELRDAIRSLKPAESLAGFDRPSAICPSDRSCRRRLSGSGLAAAA